LHQWFIQLTQEQEASSRKRRETNFLLPLFLKRSGKLVLTRPIFEAKHSTWKPFGCFNVLTMAIHPRVGKRCSGGGYNMDAINWPPDIPRRGVC